MTGIGKTLFAAVRQQGYDKVDVKKHVLCNTIAREICIQKHIKLIILEKFKGCLGMQKHSSG